jgi:segregation and condensation protein B
VTGDDERRETLADQAAAWVPPWQRPTEPGSYAETSAKPDGESGFGRVFAAGASPADAEAPGSEGDAALTVEDEPAAEAEAADAVAPHEAAVMAEDEPAPVDQPAPPAHPNAEKAMPAEAASGEAASAEAASAEAVPAEAAATLEAEAAERDAGAEGGEAAAVDVAVHAADQPVAGASSAEAEQSIADAPPAAREADAAALEAEARDAEAVELVEVAEEPVAVEAQSALALIDDAELKGALEAILLVVDEPVTEIVLAQILEQPTERVAAALVTIAEGYTAAGHGFDLRKVAGGWRLYTRPEYAPYVERFVLDGQSVRLTQAALETLAVVAYKQPVTRSRISAIRGVNCDGVIRTLVSRGLVEECGTEPDSGAFLYRTTTLFLEKLGLNSVNDLPPLAPFLPDDVEEVADATQ